VFKNSAPDRLVGVFSPIKVLFRMNTSVFQGKSTQSGGKKHIKMAGGEFSNTP
jgi:hypothetical protein